VRPFHLGAFKAAMHTGCPIVPMALRGTRQLLRDGTWLPRRAPLTLTISPALQPAKVEEPDDWKEMVRLRDATRDTISQNAGEPLL